MLPSHFIFSVAIPECKHVRDMTEETLGVGGINGSPVLPRLPSLFWTHMVLVCSMGIGFAEGGGARVLCAV